MPEQLRQLPLEIKENKQTPPEKLVREAILLFGAKSIFYKDPQEGMDPEKGFDCSGFVTHILDKMDFPKDENIRHCNEYFDSFGVLIHQGLQKRGDLVFFSKKGTYPSHMGILISPDFYIHAPGKDSTVVEIEKLRTKPIAPTPMRENQIYNVNPIGFKRLSAPSGKKRWKSRLYD